MDRLRESINLAIKEGKIIQYKLYEQEVVCMDYSKLDDIITVLQEIKKDARGCLEITFDESDVFGEMPFNIDALMEYVRGLYKNHPNIFYFASSEDTRELLRLCLSEDSTRIDMTTGSDDFGSLESDVSEELKEDIIKQTKMYGWLIGDKEENINPIIDDIFPQTNI